MGARVKVRSLEDRQGVYGTQGEQVVQPTYEVCHSIRTEACLQLSQGMTIRLHRWREEYGFLGMSAL